MQEKQIIITALSFKKIDPKPGQTFKPFVVYQIQGNDGITYESTDKDFYGKLTVGQQTTIKFEIQSKTSGGRVYTSYKIPSPTKQKEAAETDQLLAKVQDMITKSEKNILAAIRMSIGEPIIDRDIPDSNQPSLFPEEPVIAVEEDVPPF